MSTDELRQAAATLREDSEGNYLIGAVMHPGVGVALADWLDDIAERWEQNRAWIAHNYGEKHADDFMADINPHATGIARLINGGAA